MTVEEILAQMRTYSASWRAQGVTQVPIAWLDYWAQQLELARPYGRPYAPQFLGPFTVEPFWMPGLRPAGHVNVEVTRSFPFLR